MKITDLCEKVAKSSDLPPEAVQEVFERCLETIAETLQSQDQVDVGKFGAFRLQIWGEEKRQRIVLAPPR